MIKSFIPILLAGAALMASPASAQTGDPAGERVGTEHMVFEASAEGEARAHFLRGLALLHNFEYGRAAASFRKSQEADPGFVMAYWGEAMTHNHPLWDEQDRDAALKILARLGASPEERAAKARTAREAGWLAAIETLYGTSGEVGEKKARDLAYLAKMRELLEADPSDVDARAFTGLAILGSSHGGRQIPIYMEAAGLLEPGFMTHPMHPGILHYLIHSYDDPVHAPLGLRAAARYADVAPDAGHAQHMVSHIFNGLGMWEKSEKANVNADAVVDRLREAEGRAPTSCGHYNEWLVYARMQQGKEVRDIIDGCRAQVEAELARLEQGGAPGYPGAAISYGDMELRYGIETGDWRDPIEGTPPHFAKMRFDFANAEMLASLGDAERAEAALATLETEAAATIAIIKAMSADGSGQFTPWINAAVEQGRAILALSTGETKTGLAMLRAAAEAEAALPAVFGPPVIRKPSYELLGEVLLEMGRREEAADAFAKALEFAPGRRLSLEGMKAAKGG